MESREKSKFIFPLKQKGHILYPTNECTELENLSLWLTVSNKPPGSKPLQA